MDENEFCIFEISCVQNTQVIGIDQSLGHTKKTKVVFWNFVSSFLASGVKIKFDIQNPQLLNE